MSQHVSFSSVGAASPRHSDDARTDDRNTVQTPLLSVLPSPEALRTAEQLVAEMEASNPWFDGRAARVAELAGRIAQRLGLDPATVEQLRLAGRLHDIGMSRISQDVLRKNGVLSPAELCHVREHVRIGIELLEPLIGQGCVLNAIHDHHERFDGSGYPRGLAGSDISNGGQILMAADAFDALTSRRPYREPLSSRAALSRLAGDAGRALDPEVYSALRDVISGEWERTIPRDEGRYGQDGEV